MAKTLTQYEKYLRTEELLGLQKPQEDRVHNDELLFQVIHQAMELWMKEILWEVGRLNERMEADDLDQASHLLVRIARIWRLLAQALGILETMAPADYHVIRTQALGQGSGQESPGFNRLLEVPPTMWAAYCGVIERRGKTPLDIQREPLADPAAFRLTQMMMEYDELFQAWRYRHFALVKRIIGAHVLSLKGVPATALEKGTKEPLFPELWKAIELLTDEWKPTY